MEIKIINEAKDEIEFEIDSLTLAELLKEYLNEDSAVTFAAWKREHPTKNPIVKVSTKGKTPKKAISDAVSKIDKELEKVSKDFKSLK